MKQIEKNISNSFNLVKKDILEIKNQIIELQKNQNEMAKIIIDLNKTKKKY
jgi:hypothetical protein